MLKNRAYLINNLSFVYRMIIASAPLLEFAMDHSGGDLWAYYEKHLDEERGHDEMLRNDLYRLGVPEISRNHGAAALAGSQYYLIAHEHPALLLGYMSVLERAPLPIDTIDELEQFYGVEFNAMRHHAQHDPEHIKEIDKQIAMQSDHLQALIRWNASCTSDFINSMAKGF